MGRFHSAQVVKFLSVYGVYSLNTPRTVNTLRNSYGVVGECPEAAQRFEITPGSARGLIIQRGKDAVYVPLRVNRYGGGAALHPWNPMDQKPVEQFLARTGKAV